MDAHFPEERLFRVPCRENATLDLTVFVTGWKMEEQKERLEPYLLHPVDDCCHLY